MVVVLVVYLALMLFVVRRIDARMKASQSAREAALLSSCVRTGGGFHV